MNVIADDIPMPGLVNVEMDEDSDSDENDFEGEQDEEEELVNCLFCAAVLKNVDIGISHLKIKHSVDLNTLKNKFNMDQYSFIKLINFVRITKATAEIIASATKVLWEDEKYLKPLVYEPWLTYDYEEQLVEIEDKPLAFQDMNSSAKDNLIKNLLEQIKQKDNLLQNAMEDIEKMRQGLRRIVEKDVDGVKSQNCNERKSLKADESYFSSYAHFGIHHEMLSDTIRTESYRDAFLKNKDFIRGKTVLDVGCGTSILSMFASLAGAKEVVAIDNSEIIYNAMDIAKTNKFENIKFIKGRLEDTELPIDKFDIIVSEWMGYFLLFEGMLDSIIYARDRHLQPGGTLMPNRCTISLAGYGNKQRYLEYIKFWDSVYGFNMSTLKKEVLHEPLIEICNPEHILTEANVIADYNLNTVTLNYPNFEFDFNLKCNKNGTLTSFIGYFDTFFDLPNSVKFSTSAFSKPTHWKQVVFFLEQPADIKEGEIITGRICCKRSKNDLRSLDVKINVFNKEFDYYLD